MSRIFRYELRRLIWNKIFIGILAVTLFYSWLVLNSTVIRGVAHTAPFSPWSFGYYLSQILPFICLGEMFFLTFFTSRQEQRVAVITKATPVDQKKYAAVRCGTVLVGTGLLSVSAAVLGIGFMASLFGWKNVSLSFLLPTLLTLLPAVLFCFGAGWALGRIHPAFVYGVMVLPFLLTYLPMPQAIEFSLGQFFGEYPAALDILDPAFSVPISVILGRALYAALGIALLLLGGVEKAEKRSAGLEKR